MTIKEVEQMTGLTRSNIRYYEKEKLICPKRNENNGYREYSSEDVENIKKIAYLRTLGISIEDILKLLNKDADLYTVVKKQRRILEKQISELQSAKVLCERMLSSKDKVSYQNLEVEQYITNLQDYWKENKNVFKLDSVHFFYMWGGNITWIALTIICFLVAVFSIGDLPAQIPVQWSNGVGSSFADKKFIFAFPVACVMIKYLLRPVIWNRLRMNVMESEDITNYITNYLCFIVLSVEVFIILYVNEIVRNVILLLLVDTVGLIGVLMLACYRLNKEGRKR